MAPTGAELAEVRRQLLVRGGFWKRLKEAIPGRWCWRLTLQGEDGLRSAQLAPGMDVTNCSLFSKAKIRLGILEMGETGRTPR